jgi:tRNA pseudouridine38-40 synthase
MFLEGKTDVNTFDCTILKQLETKQQPTRIYDFGQSFFEKYGSFYCGNISKCGLNKITLDDFNTIISTKNRDKGFSVPAHGLYLTEIEYDYL